MTNSAVMSRDQELPEDLVEMNVGASMVEHGADASSISKALQLFEILANHGRSAMGVSELAAAAGLPKSTTHRLLAELMRYSLVGRVGPKYAVGVGLFRWYSEARLSVYGALRDGCLQGLENLFEETGQTVHLAVLDGTDVLYLEKLTGRGGSRIPSSVGSRLPASCTSLGKSLLAFSSKATVAKVLQAPLSRLTGYSIAVPKLLASELLEVRSNGVAHDRGEVRSGLTCIGAPILVDDEAVAAISIASMDQRVSIDRWSGLLQSVSQELGEVVAAWAS